MVTKVKVENPTYIDPSLVLYDIESLPHDYSLAVYNAHLKRAIIFVHSKSSLDEATITQALQRRFPTLIERVDLKTDETDYANLRHYLLRGDENDGLTRAGWNSKHYDMPMLYANVSSDPESNRRVSDQIIRDQVRPYKLTYTSTGAQIDYQDFKSIVNDEHQIDIAVLNEKSGDVDDKVRTPGSLKMVSAYAGLEVLDDEITRIDFDSWSPAYYESLDSDLKKNINPDGSLTTVGLTNMILYNMQDVMNTGFLFNEPEYVGTYRTKLNLLHKYHVNENGNLAGPSETSARISSLILTQNDPDRFSDYDVVNFNFPRPDGTTIDLLDYVYEQKIIPRDVYDYYDNLRGLNVSTLEGQRESIHKNDTTLSYRRYVKQVLGFDSDEVEVRPKIAWDEKKADGKYKSATNSSVTVPYFDKDFNPIESVNTFSIGGSHGSTAHNYAEFTWDNARMIKLSKEIIDGLPTIIYNSEDVLDKKTTDTTAWAIDVGSFYPTFLVLLKIYLAMDGVDVYDEIRTDRLRLKESLPENTADFTDEDRRINKEQKDAKLILNSVSGASNTRSEYALLRLDNAIVSMRCMGNLFIYMIGTAFVRKFGARVPSTNTDGIETSYDHLETPPTKEEIFAYAKELTDEWGFSLEPERLERFVAKDSNNRLEWHKKKANDSGSMASDSELIINKVAGKLGKGFNPNYHKGEPNRINLDSKLDHPMVTDLAVIEFIDEHRDFLSPELKVLKPTKTRPRTAEVLEWLENWMRDYANGSYYNTAFNVMDWTLFTKGNRSRKFFADGSPLQDNNRYIYSASKGQVITSTLEGSPRKISGWTSNEAQIVNTIESLNAVDPADLDYHAYALWAYNTLLTWVNKDQTRPDAKPKAPKRDYTPLSLFAPIKVEKYKIPSNVLDYFRK